MSTTLTPVKYKSQSARDAQDSGYGKQSYWEYLDQHAQELHDFYMNRGDTKTAEEMFTRSLGKSLQGNEGL